VLLEHPAKGTMCLDYCNRLLGNGKRLVGTMKVPGQDQSVIAESCCEHGTCHQFRGFVAGSASCKLGAEHIGGFLEGHRGLHEPFFIDQHPALIDQESIRIDDNRSALLWFALLLAEDAHVKLFSGGFRPTPPSRHRNGESVPAADGPGLSAGTGRTPGAPLPRSCPALGPQWASVSYGRIPGIPAITVRGPCSFAVSAPDPVLLAGEGFAAVGEPGKNTVGVCNVGFDSALVLAADRGVECHGEAVID